MLEEKLQFRIHGDDSLPTLIYLPGLHGDWTLVGSFRKNILGKIRFVEMTYPRTLAWSLDDYAAAIEKALAENGIAHGWLLGESFGSQVLWAIVQRKQFQIDGAILAGGFVRLPLWRALRLAERMGGKLSLSLITQLIFPVTNKIFAWFYEKLARIRFRCSPETLDKIKEFLDRRTPLDFEAAKHRLHLVAQNNPCEIAQNATMPVFALTGWFDPIVPWFFVRRWMRKNCPALRDYKIIARADHVVLATAAQESAEQILKWMNVNLCH